MSDRTNDVERHGLNYVMEFDHVIRVDPQGRVFDDGLDSIYAPELMDDEIEGDEWEFFSVGYTGQYGYNGPIMHNSELLSGRLEQDILSTPGIYVAVVSYYTETEIEEGEEHWSDGTEPYAEGWAVLRLRDS